MPTKKTPGVYIKEMNAFPNSVVEVPTSIPVFVGYTEKAARGTQDLKGKPTRVSSLSEYQTLFGGPPSTQYAFAMADGRPRVTAVAETRFNLCDGLRLFFDNGGGPCWIVSTGGYGTQVQPVTKSAGDFGPEIWDELENEREPSLVVIPDAVLMPNVDDYKAIWDLAFPHCIKMQNRIAIVDVFDGDKKRTFDYRSDVISGQNGLRSKLNYSDMSFGTVYYPWLNTTLYAIDEVSYADVRRDSLAALAEYIRAEFQRPETARLKADVDTLLGTMTGDAADPATIKMTHAALSAISARYEETMQDLLAVKNLMPPSGAMAGVIARMDNLVGVFKAPANTGIISVTSPAVAISDEEQQDLNVSLDGMAVNAIRTIIGRGVLIRGARTLNGNSQDWRYLSVRRTVIMLEQSIALAARAYVFEPNDANTWMTVKTMIDNFLNNQWKAGTLAGSTPAEAYSVDVGLGSTMTAADLLDGYMRVTVRVAITRPAEFIVITFQQKMQTS